MLYFIFHTILRYRFAVVMQNLARSFPERSYEEINHIATRFYRYFSHMFLEWLAMVLLSEKQMKKRVQVNNTALLEHYHAQQRNIIIMLGHYGNWEYANILPSYLSFDVHAVFKPLSNRLFDRIMRKLRSRFGLKLLSMDKVVRYMHANRERPGAYIFVSDQSPSQENRFTMDFLHQPTNVITGAERIAKKLDAVVVYAVINKRTASSHWEISFSLITDQAAATPEHAITKTFSECLEQDIRRSPEYWLWSHRRWKNNRS